MGEKGENIEFLYKRLCLKGQAEDEYYKQLVKDTLRYKNELGKGLYAKEYQEMIDLKNQVHQLRNEGLKPLVLVSIRPPDTVEFKVFKNIVDKILNKKWLKDYILVWEQKGETIETMGKGKHIHILLNRNGKKFSEVKREIDNTIKCIIDLKVYSAHDYKLASDDDDNVVRLKNYILGTKKDEYKHPAQEIDILFREKYNLKSYYQSGNI